MGEFRDELREAVTERFRPVVAEIERLLEQKEKEVILVAIDGKCGSGKSTLGAYLQERFDCNLFHMDDFYLQSFQRTEQRLREAGGNVDYERFYKEVLQPVLAGQTVRYRIFSCATWTIDKEYNIPPKRLNIVEGSYSQHPYFHNPYDLCFFLDIDDANQIENIRKRNGAEKLEMFKAKWIPMENRYFEAFKIKEKSRVIPWENSNGK